MNKMREEIDGAQRLELAIDEQKRPSRHLSLMTLMEDMQVARESEHMVFSGKEALKQFTDERLEISSKIA